MQMQNLDIDTIKNKYHTNHHLLKFQNLHYNKNYRISDKQYSRDYNNHTNPK